VLINLLSNAFKFTSEGEVRLSLSATTLDDGSRRIVVLVADTGMGIEPEQLESVFGAFKQAKQLTTHTGTGLGLAVSRRFAQLLGGNLTATSQLGQGSEFRFEFSAEPLDAIHVAKAEASVVGLMPNSKVAKVLVVDDQADNRNLLCALLRAIGLTVRAASSGEEALAALAAEPFDLMLLDLRMPGMDGFEVIDRVRKNETEARLPVVIVSASALEDEQRLAVERGADGFLSKPVNERALFAMIQQLTGVQYRRASHELQPAPEDDPQPEARRVGGAGLPTELVDALCSAARRGDIATIDAYVAQAATHDQAMGARLKALADSFDYETLVAELERMVQS